MDPDPGLQRAFDWVELVGGSIGDPGEGRMCLMSLVAFLAGEPHSDSPGCASPLVQAFAVLVNDHMQHAARQRLKPFAPRIIGTDDGLDGARTALLLHALAEGFLAGAPGQDLARAAAPPNGGVFAKLRRLWRWLRKDQRQRLLHFALSRGDGVELAREAARLIARSAHRAPNARERERHWDAAIGCWTGCAAWARRRRSAAGRVCGPSAWCCSRTRPDRTSTRADGRREDPRCACSGDARPAGGGHETAGTMPSVPTGPTPLAACVPQCQERDDARRSDPGTTPSTEASKPPGGRGRRGGVTERLAGLLLAMPEHGNHLEIRTTDGKEGRMAKIHYKVVEHDGGWAYKLGDVFSEAFPDRAAALAAAKRVAAEQHVPGDAAHIEYQDEAGRWRTEFSAGDDRPDADVTG